MNRKTAERKLAALGFQVDWSCTVKVDGFWMGTMDAIGRGQIDGDCRGEAINSGSTLAEFFRDCIEAAEGYAKRGPNSLCVDPGCDFHSGEEI